MLTKQQHIGKVRVRVDAVNKKYQQRDQLQQPVSQSRYGAVSEA